MFVEKENNLNHSDSQAEVSCRQSMADAGFSFGSPPTTFHWSQLINPAGDKKSAKSAYEALLISEPHNKSALEGLAYLYQTMGLFSQAQEYRKKLRYAEVKEMGIDDESQHNAVEFLQAKNGEALQPETMPVALIAAYFDKHAAKYDKLLLETLEYKGHDLVREQVAELHKSMGKALSVLDLGCGTGLIGESLFSFSTTVHGVDISKEMINYAKQRNVYDQLYTEDFLVAIKPMKQEYDLITAIDVLNYQGDLEETFYRVHDTLNNGGEFIFTVEQGSSKDFMLKNSGRYRHSDEYILKLSHQNDFTVIFDENVDLRKDKGSYVDAKLYRLQKSA